MRLLLGVCSASAAVLSATTVFAQDSRLAPADQVVWAVERLESPAFAFDDDARFAASDVLTGQGLVRRTTGEVLLSDQGAAVDRLRVTRGGLLRDEGGAPAFFGDGALGDEQVDVTWLRGWPSAVRFEGEDLDLDITPHAGLGFGASGGSAEAGATVRLGADLGDRLDGLVEDGDRFGQRPRWYLFAAANKRAVGYNVTSGPDGWGRAGVSTDEGAFIGDAQAGVAWRKGDLQASFGYVQREIKARAPHGAERTSADESLVAFQLSLKPSW
ncbi:MAG TPA: lipid A-modifier LpxR family protein [Caulobacteraceae bacterium]|nr:lipid A-modifier LpxR family protein [Caulobacteraceae bacterium]